MEAKDNRNRSAYQIKILVDSKAVTANYDRDRYARVPRKNKARNGVLPPHKNQGKKKPKHIGAQNY